MWVEEIVVNGFKSYSAEVPIGPLDPSFNAITGLNGTGKSNILDSICFVLGITTLSHVRVSKLDELVYKQGNAGVSSAVVKITFNNEDKKYAPKKAPKNAAHNDKIVVERSVVIGGRNRYRVNGQLRNDKDVREMFQSIGLNVNNPHFLIMQGRITKVINMGPKETLSMLEEAAGTKMYETKRIKALAHMDKKDGKMRTIEDMMTNEIGPELENLKKQKIDYMKYQKNTLHIAQIRKHIIALDWQQFIRNIEAGTEELASVSEELKTAAEKAERTNTEFQKLDQELVEKGAQQADEKEFAELKEREKKSAKEKNTKEVEKKGLEKDRDVEKKRVEGQAGLVERTEERLAETEYKVQQAEKEADAKKKQLDDQKEEVERLKKKLQEGDAAEGETVSQQLSTAKRDLKQLAADCQIAKDNLKEQTVALEDVEAKMKQLGAKVSADEKAVSQARKKIESVEAQIQKLGFDNDRWHQIMGPEDQIPTKHNSLKAALEDEWQVFQTENARYQQGPWGHLLWDLDSETGPLSDLQHGRGKRDLIRQQNFTPQQKASFLGTVASMISLKPEFADYGFAVETAVGGKMDTVLLKDSSLVKFLTANITVRTVTPLPNIPPTRALSRQEVEQVKRKVGNAGLVYVVKDCLDYPPEIERYMERNFGQIFVSDTREAARIVADSHGNGRAFNCTDKKGDQFDTGGTLSGGAQKPLKSRFEYVEEMREMEKWSQTMGKKWKELEKEEKRMNDLWHPWMELTGELKSHQNALKNCEQAIAHSAAGSLKSRRDELNTEIAELKAFVGAEKDTQTRLQQKIQNLEAEFKALDGGLEAREKELKGQLKQLVSTIKPLQTDVAKLQKKIDLAEAEHESAKTEVDRLKQQTIAGKLADIEARLQSATEALETAVEEWEMVKDQVHEAKKRREKISAEEKAIQKQRDKAKKAHEVAVENEAKANAKYEERDSKLRDAEKAKLSLEECSHNAWLLRDQRYFGKKGSDYDFGGKDRDQKSAEVQELDRENKILERKVNKKCIAQYEQCAAVYEENKGKVEKLRNDKVKIQELIAQIDVTKSKMLAVTHTKVNAHFNTIFSQLLKGATCGLYKLDGCQRVEEGLQIQVSFSGKSKKGLTELSGGQRSLLSLSLILACLKYKPAPFYILDEVDSALDLSHTQNIGRMIKDCFPESQFIVVSLKDGLFENANVLFRTKFANNSSGVIRFDQTASAKKKLKALLADEARKKEAEEAGAGASDSEDEEPKAKRKKK